MQVLLHLIKQELLAHRTLIVAWVAVQIAQTIFAITGMAGEFYRPLTSPLTEQAMMLFSLVHAIGIVLLPGAIALYDPPTDESAHWRALPVQAWQLLTTKLAAVFVGVILPILCGQTFSLICSDAGQWTADMLADQSGYLPAWIGVGFCLGAVAGDRRRFAIAIASLLVGTSLLMFVVHASSQHSHAAGRFEIAMMLLDDGLTNVFTNNLFLIGAGLAILLRYFTRIHGAWLAVVFVLGIPATPLIAPRLLTGFIPGLHLSTQTEIAEVRASYDPPERILIVTNNAGVRWQGYSPYSALHFHGVGPSQFVMPTKLETHLWTHNEERTSFTAIGQDWFRFAGSQSLRPWDLDALHSLERHITLSNAVPGRTVINPPFEPGDGFTLFDLEEHVALQNTNATMRLTTQLHANVGRYVLTGELPLQVDARLAINGTCIRVAALNLAGADKTQIRLNIRHVQFATEKDNVHVGESIDPRRGPANLRYILVNESRNEACLPTRRQWTERPHPHPLAFRTIVLDYAIADGPQIDRPIDAEWLKGAKLHVFRAMIARQPVLLNTMENFDIFNIPREPLAQPAEVRYR